MKPNEIANDQNDGEPLPEMKECDLAQAHTFWSEQDLPARRSAMALPIAGGSGPHGRTATLVMKNKRRHAREICRDASEIWRDGIRDLPRYPSRETSANLGKARFLVDFRPHNPNDCLPAAIAESAPSRSSSGSSWKINDLPKPENEQAEGPGEQLHGGT